MPDPDALMFAADWLEEYDSDAREVGQMREVAQWLRQRAQEQQERDIARKQRTTVEKVRASLKRVSSSSGVPIDVLRQKLLES